ncbi:MAG: hypothetical protein KGM98_03950 [Bacteroidota bacterium]|nr:hypothetical protein [Bacteroidota bacterium]
MEIRNCKWMLNALVFFAVAAISSCAKEYSYEGGPPAIYELDGAPGQCQQSQLFGYFYTGVATDAQDSFQVRVHVSSTGHYNIYTNPVDGIRFSAAGSFQDTGWVSLFLISSGTPDSAGTFPVVIPGLTGCSSSLTVLSKPPSSYYLAGYPNDCQNPQINGPYIAGQAFRSDNTVQVNVTINSPGDYLIKTDTLDGMSFADSGYFSAPGSRVVTLKGTGKPLNPGLIFFTVYSDSSLCNFSIPVQTAIPQAVYVLESGVGDTNYVCTPHVVSGSYVAGVPLNMADSVTIGIYVKTVGNYSVSTNKINGMVFSRSGTFTATGEQHLTLYGSGQPTSSGDFNFKPMIIGPAPLGGNACNFGVIIQ